MGYLRLTSAILEHDVYALVSLRNHIEGTFLICMDTWYACRSGFWRGNRMKNNERFALRHRRRVIKSSCLLLGPRLWLIPCDISELLAQTLHREVFGATVPNHLKTWWRESWNVVCMTVSKLWLCIAMWFSSSYQARGNAVAKRNLVFKPPDMYLQWSTPSRRILFCHFLTPG